MKPAAAPPWDEGQVSRETLTRLRDFLKLLRRWNERINLVADAPEEEQWRRHILDSLQLLPLLPERPEPLIDLGSGAGFPGIVLAVATGCETHLVEADRRKAAFLIESCQQLSLTRVSVHPTRIERATLAPARVVTARALAPLAALVPHAYRLLMPGGIALFPKGRTAEDEFTTIATDWTMRTERFTSRTDPSATILRLSEIHPAKSHA